MVTYTGLVNDRPTACLKNCANLFFVRTLSNFGHLWINQNGHNFTTHSCINVWTTGMEPEIFHKTDNKTANIYVKKTIVLNALVTMTLESDVENSKN